MGWELHITKRDFWADEDGESISREDWIEYVNSDESIVRDSNNTEDDFLFRSGNEECPIWWNPDIGEIYTKNPSEATIQKFREIAAKLGATVQDDDGEIY